MAIRLNTSYSKKLGLPGFSSHSFSASVEVELGDINQAGTECARLYGLLQASVDHEIRNTGFVPDAGYGMDPAAAPQPGIGSGTLPPRNGNSTNSGNGDSPDRGWNCSPKQRDLILKIVAENGLDKSEVDALAQDRFGTGVKMLNKLQASGLISELIENTDRRGKRGNGKPQANGYARKGGAR